MKMDLQTVGFNADVTLTDYARAKTESLYKFYDQIVGAEVYLKLDNHDKKQTKVAEIKLNIPGNDIFAESRSEKFEGAINETIDKLKMQLRKVKTKLSAQ